jgi:SAM-dependent methyltransferase
MAGDEAELDIRKDRIRKRLLKYTRRAFGLLPHLDRPRILDLGCGSGVPTMELARLSNGEVIGLDNDGRLLAMLEAKVERAGLSGRVKAVNGRILDVNFPEASFDVIWAEGSLHIVGFRKGLRWCRGLLEPGGFLVAHDGGHDIGGKRQQILRTGYELMAHFALDNDTWRREYFAPLQDAVDDIRSRHPTDAAVLAALESEQREIDMAVDDPDSVCSLFLVMRKV